MTEEEGVNKMQTYRSQWLVVPKKTKISAYYIAPCTQAVVHVCILLK